MATSTHFGQLEMECHGKKCGPGTGCHWNGAREGLVNALEQFRAKVAKPVIVNDAYRCERHNAEVGGAPHSEHLLGLAADIEVPGMTAVELEAIALDCDLITAIGRADHQAYVHIDVRELRPGQERIRWCYDAKGAAVKFFKAALVDQVTMVG